MSSGGEDRLTAWLRRRLEKRGSTLLGDDTALLRYSRRLLVTTDHQIAGTHFPADLPPRTCARRLLAVCLSDLAACGGVPAHAFLNLAAPEGFAHRAYLDSLLRACDRYRVTLAGGDLARAPALSTSLTLIGTLEPRAKALRRDKGRPGDRLWLGGTVGESAVGRLLIQAGARPAGSGFHIPESLDLPASLQRAARSALRRHLLPRPQLELGRWLSRRRRCASIDVSDGLALDLSRLCRESGVGAVLEASALVPSRGLARLAHHLETPAERLVLSGGEDYVLLFALPPTLRPPDRFECRPVGQLTSSRRLLLQRGTRSHRLPIRGWDHLSPSR